MNNSSHLTWLKEFDWKKKKKKKKSLNCEIKVQVEGQGHEHSSTVGAHKEGRMS